MSREKSCCPREAGFVKNKTSSSLLVILRKKLIFFFNFHCSKLFLSLKIIKLVYDQKFVTSFQLRSNKSKFHSIYAKNRLNVRTKKF
jgi:hypothetical protein